MSAERLSDLRRYEQLKREVEMIEARTLYERLRWKAFWWWYEGDTGRTRSVYIRALHAQRVKVCVIALHVGLSEQRVRQILCK